MMLCERKFWQHFMTALAAIASVATLISFLFNWKTDNFSTLFSQLFTLAIFALCLFYAFTMTYDKNLIRLSLNPGFHITVEKGDLFNKAGIIVIPVNEYFDTIVDDEIISPNSVHGKWINRFWKSRISELDNLIETELRGRKYKSDPNRTRGKKNKYSLGECISIRVPENNNLYVLFVLTNFDRDNHAYLKHEDFPVVIDSLFSYLERKATDRRVYMPLFGTGLSRLNRSPQRILTLILDALDFKHSQRSFPYGIYIELYSTNNINLSQIEELFHSNIHRE